jgi:nucleoside-diphosphate-sugar epimerase
MKALIVGGSGWVGGTVATLLDEQGWEVVSLSRRGTSVAGAGIRGDVRRPNLGLTPAEAEQVADGLTHVLSCFGSVDWALGPRQALDLHLDGTRNVLAFAERCDSLERLVHVSSVLALGRAEGQVGNRELDLGQSFRNWYEYAKHVSEKEVRERHTLPRRIVRLGDIMGAGGATRPSPRDGLLAPLPFLLRGYPVHMHRGGDFPIYVGEVGVCAAVLARALTEEAGGLTWTWFDGAMPTLAEVLIALCSPWNVVPRLVDVPAMHRVTRWAAPRLGVPRAILEYAKPWVDIDPRVLDQLPADLPECPTGYIERTTEHMQPAIGQAAVGLV